MAHRERRIKVHDLLFDPDNPRHDPIADEPATIKYLVENEGIRGLAESIARLNSLSPIEMMAVIAHPTLKGRYTSFEGNRRICALRLLADPEKGPAEPDRRYFRMLRDSMKKPLREIDVIEFDTFEELRPWLEIRHGGYGNGEGLREWDTKGKTRFNRGGSKDNPNALALALIGYARANDLVTPKEAEALSLTTLTRFLANPVFRTTLGIVSKTTDHTLSFNVDAAQFNKAVRKFLIDSLTPRSPVNSRTSVEDRVAYAKDMTKRGLAPKTVKGPATQVDPDTGEIKTPAPVKRSSRDTRNPRDRAHVIPAGFQVAIKDNIVRRVYGELKKIDTSEFAFSANYLLRALIELTARRYCKKHGITFEERDLHKTLLKIDTDLQAKGVKEHVTKGLRVAANRPDSSYSPETLGSVVHGSAVQDRRALNDAWDNVGPGLREMLTRL